jgi:hypothetical protein
MRTVVGMSTNPIEPGLADNLNRRLLAASQLQIQAARSVALDGGALGVVAVDIAVAAIVLGARGAYDLWILALLLLGLSLGLAVQTLRLPGAERIGPPPSQTPLEVREAQDEHSLEDSILNDLAEDIETNEHALDRRDPPFERALAFLVLAIVVELAGRLL